MNSQNLYEYCHTDPMWTCLKWNLLYSELGIQTEQT